MRRRNEGGEREEGRRRMRERNEGGEGRRDGGG